MGQLQSLCSGGDVLGAIFFGKLRPQPLPRNAIRLHETYKAQSRWNEFLESENVSRDRGNDDVVMGLLQAGGVDIREEGLAFPWGLAQHCTWELDSCMEMGEDM